MLNSFEVLHLVCLKVLTPVTDITCSILATLCDCIGRYINARTIG